MSVASSRRYAQAAFAIALERDALEVWERDLAFAREVLSDDDLLALMAAPSVPYNVKQDGIDTMLGQSDPLVRNLVSLMTGNGDIERFDEMCRAFDRLLDEHRRIGRAEVITAVPLDDARRDQIKERLTDITGYDRVEMTEVVDSSILGGVIARVGDRLIDGSARSRLRSMRDALSERPVSV